MPFTSRKIQKATMRKFSVMVTKSPHASTGPAFCAASSGSLRPEFAAVKAACACLTLSDSGR